VLLLDRRSFPREKACGGGVPPGTVEILNDLGMGEKIRGAGFYPVSGIRIGSPHGHIWETEFKPKRAHVQFYVARRDRFDAIIKEHAVESGATFLQANVKAPGFEDGRVTGVWAVVDGRETEISGRVVIASDGATSTLARALRSGAGHPARHRAVAVRAYVEGIDLLPHRVEFYFYKRFVPGYGWIFPLGESRANVGVVVRADRYIKNKLRLQELLYELLALPPVKGRLDPGYRVEGTATWQLTFAPNRPVRRAFDGALLVGDAGSFVDPLTGEGIHNALVSARIAAGVVSDALGRAQTSPRSLAEYDARCESALGGSLKRSYHVQKWVGLAPWWVDLLFMFANANRRVFGSFLNRMSTDFVIDT
jgi:geranylgeranyl reductase family protein